MSELRMCKECGKMFKPVGRESYCKDIHYRPCPICGTKVEAKYLSDPPRCCSKECQQKARALKKIQPKAKITKPIETKPKAGTLFQQFITNPTDKLFTPQGIDKPTENLENPGETKVNLPGRIKITNKASNTTNIGDYPIKVFKMHSMMGWEHNHQYQLEITKKPDQPYMIFATHDFTLDKPVNLAIPLSSQISIARYFSDE